jgi:hypothetical protein
MRKLLVGAVSILVLCQTGFSQEEEKGLDFYAAAGVSISNSKYSSFDLNSYPSVEFGLMKNNFSLGLSAGRSDFHQYYKEDISNYWYELKTAVSFPIGNLNGYGLLGLGNYMSTDRIFIEYGLGFSYLFTDHIGAYGQVSNWDGTWYITPGLSYTF